MFNLDQRIANDSKLIVELDLCQVRLSNDQRYPWLVLIPKINNVTEVHELSDAQQQQLITESSVMAKALKTVTGCKKINVANLGNVVSQLHWHIVAREETDLTWPGPVWGVGKAEPWQDQKRAEFIDSLLTVLPS